MLRVADWFRIFAAIALLALAVISIMFTRSIDEMEDAAGRTMRHDLAWSGVNGRLEFGQLEKHLARFAAAGDPADADAARLNAQFVRGRLAIWAAGDFRRFLQTSPAREAQFDQIIAGLDGLESRLASLTRDSALSILKALEPTSMLMNRLGADAFTVTVLSASMLKAKLARKQTIQRRMFVSVVGAGVLLILLMAFQTRFLRRSHRAAEKSAFDYAFLARHDLLTGLSNRSAFIDAISTMRKQNVGDRRGDGKIAILAIDLDGFKAVNDTLGHSAGDALLVSIAGRLRQAVSGWSGADTVSRFGGDEFVLLLHVADRPEALAKARWLSHILREPHDLLAGTITVEATIGVAFLDGRDNPAAAHQNADLALTYAKSTGKGIVQEYGPAMRDTILRRSRLESDLRGAIRKREILPFYQPQVNLKTGEIVGVEALARWHHPQLGWISPAEFIPVAESSGQIADLGRAILETACRDAVSFPSKLPVSVNLSVVQLRLEDFADTVSQILKESDLAPGRLKLEVTESVLMHDADRSIAALRRLKQLGVSISLDDFGTGYSALSYLRLFDWDEIKIDRSFVSNITTDAHCRSIVEVIVMLASQLEIGVTAEGIEDTDQSLALREVGCVVGQGYLFSAAVPADRLNARLLATISSSATIGRVQGVRDPGGTETLRIISGGKTLPAS
jgi:diguanylate cyclase (GGDEF)-like protein